MKEKREENRLEQEKKRFPKRGLILLDLQRQISIDSEGLDLY